MRSPHREGLTALLTVCALGAAVGCGNGDLIPVPGTEDAVMSSATVRAGRRAYDGAPPVVPHDDFGMACSACHDDVGMPVRDVGFAPPSPHEGTARDFSTTRCRQCHVFVLDEGVFVGSDFVGLRQDLRRGGRLAANSPPTLPHRIQMRENCRACHTGPAARVEIATTHPERDRCTQCHVAVTTDELFESVSRPGPTNPEGS